MSNWLSVPYFILWALWALLLLIIVLPLQVILFTILLIITLPYTLYHYSPNMGMNKKYMPPVQLYLDHFERLHTELISSVVKAHKFTTKGKPPGIRFWPVKNYERVVTGIPLVVSVTSQKWTFSQAAGLFARLEASEVADRQVLWTFLRDEVERAGLVNEAEKEAFKKVMTVMCTHRLLAQISKMLLPRNGSSGRSDESAAPPGRNMPVGVEVVLVKEDSVEWILHRGALLVPAKGVRLGKLTNFKMWGKVGKDIDVEKGLGNYWQLIDIRGPEGYPWDRWGKKQMSAIGCVP
jgi:hypothetical protein